MTSKSVWGFGNFLNFNGRTKMKACLIESNSFDVNLPIEDLLEEIKAVVTEKTEFINFKHNFWSVRTISIHCKD